MSARSRRSPIVSRLDGGEEIVRFFDRKDRGLALLHHVLRAADGAGRIHLHDLADDHVVEEHPDGSQVLLHARRVKGLPQLLYIGGDEHRLQLFQGNLVRLAPVEESAGGPGIRLTGVPIPDVCGEELDELPARVLHRRRRWGRVTWGGGLQVDRAAEG